MLSEKAEKIFKLKYAKNGEELWEDACFRIANHVASAERNYTDGDKNYEMFLPAYYSMIYERKFIPGGRILANAGTKIKNLFNCFVLPVEDSRNSIYNTLHDAAEIFAWGGGIGYNFSDIREEGSPIKTTGGQASGPLSFMQLFDTTGEVIQQASRRGAQMGMLDVDHPDIEKFIKFKAVPNTRNKRLLEEYHRNLEITGGKLKNTRYFDILQKTLLDDQLTHFNISVVVPDEFMQAVAEGKDWDLISRYNGEKYSVVSSIDLFDTIAKQAWESGDPGIYFIDHANKDNLVVNYEGQLQATNPCGEIGLYPYESCNLGSINLYEMLTEDKKHIDFERLSFVTQLAVRFLDNVHDLSENLIPELNETSHKFRRLGLGVMGWADLLAELEVPYDSEEAEKLILAIGFCIQFNAWVGSHYLAIERGIFPAFDSSKINLRAFENIFPQLDTPDLSVRKRFADEFKLRNVSVTAIAPNGTIALIADVNSGIEPFFSLAYRRHLTQGVGNIATDTLVELNPILHRKLEQLNLTEEQMDKVLETLYKTGSIQSLDFLPEDFRNVFKTSHEIRWEDHIKTQANWQKWISNSISKTINMPHDATIADIKHAYFMAWELGCKGITIYRDKSKSFQILNSGLA